MAQSALRWLAGADATALTAAEQASCLRALERAEAALTAARSTVLAGFDAACAFQDSGHGTARTWLKWQTRVTGAAAGSAVGWMRRLTAHRAVRDALAAGTISASWARAICDWTDLLPAHARDDADLILLAAAAAGAALADLAGLAEELRKRTAHPDEDGDDGFEDRSVRLTTHYRGAGKLTGDLTPRCAAAMQAGRSPSCGRGDGLRWSCGFWQGAEPLPAGGERLLPRPGAADLQHALAGVADEAGGQVPQPVSQGLRLGGSSSG